MSKTCCICFETMVCKQKHNTLFLLRGNVQCKCPTFLVKKERICPHTFCFQCIEKWSLNNTSCPLCRKGFNKIQNNHYQLRFNLS